MQSGLAPRPRVVVENPEGYQLQRSPLRQGISTPHQAPQRRTPVPGKGAHVTPGCGHQQGFRYPGEMKGCCKPRRSLQVPVK